MPIFPSFLRILRQPRHQRFHIEPRYYDPVKEEIRVRTEKIKSQMEKGNEEIEYTSSIKFKRKTKPARFTSLIQLFLAVYLGGLVVGWLQYGNEALYYFMWITLFIFLVYRVIKMRQNR